MPLSLRHRLAALFTALCAAEASARAQDETAKPVEDLRAVEKALIEKAAEESRLENEAAQHERDLAELRYRMIETANALQEAEQSVTEISAEIGALEVEQKKIAASLAVEQGNLGDVLAALQSLERSRPPALLVSPDDANRAARIAMLLADAAPELERRAASLRASIERLDAVNANLNAERQKLQDTNKEIAARRDVLADLVAQKETDRDVAASLAAAAQRETAALAARATSLRGILRRLEKFARAITPRVKPPREAMNASAPSRKPPRAAPIFSPAKSFAGAKGALRAPVAGRLIGAFRARRPEGGRFDGLRFSTANNAIVTAPFEADVAFARSWDPIGNLIVLDVGEGYHILIMGVGAFLVEEGQEVAAGEPLGTMEGENARLDLEIRQNGEPVNPALWLSGNGENGKAF